MRCESTEQILSVCFINHLYNINTLLLLKHKNPLLVYLASSASNHCLTGFSGIAEQILQAEACRALFSCQKR